MLLNLLVRVFLLLLKLADVSLLRFFFQVLALGSSANTKLGPMVI